MATALRQQDKMKSAPISATEMLAVEAHRLGRPYFLADEAQALCLSGGGIRSATFSLGIMQGLASHHRLSQFDYLSTVSGGGYIGSWLSMCHHEGKPLEDALKETPDTGEKTDHPVRRLRSFSNYLSPQWGFSLDTMTVATIFVLNLLFNLMLWIPLLLIVASLPRAIISISTWLMPRNGLFWRYGHIDAVSAATWLVPALSALIWLVLGLLILLAIWAGDTFREKLSRIAAAPLLFGLPWLLLFLLFFDLPMVAVQKLAPLEHSTIWAPAAAGLLAALTAVAGFWGRYGTEFRRTAQGLAARLGARLLDLVAALSLVALALVAAIAVELWLDHGKLDFRQVRPLPDWKLWISLAALTAWVTLVSIPIGVNRFSLHALYGNRLVRAYLGSARDARSPSALTDFDPRDNIPMSWLPGGSELPESDTDDGPAAAPPPEMRPFHVINMTLNLTRRRGQRRDWQERKGASFIATPLHCGAESVGYVAPEDYGGKWGMTLGRAMTISGAAASPNMGYHSSPLMALVMTFFNIRLGWWAPHPGRPSRRSEPLFGLRYVLFEALSGTSDKSKWLYLSDGGHFDNLGLYEMIRRRCRRIVIVDASCDGTFKYADLHNAVRKAGIDFSVPIDLPAMLPGQASGDVSERVVRGCIRYSAVDPDHADGELFLVKPVLLSNDPPSLRHFAETSRRGGKTFPHHSTTDQFFNETQFESYRQLGELSALDLIRALDGEAAALEPALPSNSSVTIPGETAPEKPPPANLTGLRGIATGLQGLPPVHLIAAALATAGTLGAITGVGYNIGDRVSHARPAPPSTPSELRLSDADRALLEPDLTITSDQQALTALQALVGRLEALNRSRFAPLQVDPRFYSAIGALTKALQNYTTAGQLPQSDAKELGDILRLLQDPDKGLTANNKNLTEIVRQLRIIAGRIDTANPRRNVSGQ